MLNSKRKFLDLVKGVSELMLKKVKSPQSCQNKTQKHTKFKVGITNFNTKKTT